MPHKLVHGGKLEMRRISATKRTFTVKARPKSIVLSVEETAVIVVDMQHAYASPGGYLDICGRSVADAGQVIAKIGDVLDAARSERV